MQKRSFAGLLSGLLAVSALAAPPIYAQGTAPAMAPVALGFETMAPVSGPYVGAANPIRNIAGGGLPWIISSAQGELRADGELTVSVRGLVLAQAEPVPGNLQGVNPAPTFHAVVSCQSVDDAGAPMVASVRTADVAASPTGDADISETVHFLSRASHRLCSFRVVPASAAGSPQPAARKCPHRTAIQTAASGVCVNEPAKAPTLSRAP